jgi:hypothetical protein
VCVCVLACVCVCLRVLVCVCLWVRACACVCMRSVGRERIIHHSKAKSALACFMLPLFQSTSRSKRTTEIDHSYQDNQQSNLKIES